MTKQWSSKVILLSVFSAISVLHCAGEEGVGDAGVRRDVADADVQTARRDVPTGTSMDVLDQDADPEPEADGGVVAFDVPDFDAPDPVVDVPNAMVDVPNARPDVRVTDSGRPIARTIGYRMATYTQRGNWVLDCGRGYAYTARGGDHVLEDCDHAYAPDGTLRGTATFLFRAVIPGNYDVIIASRFSMNRDPAGALFTVNGMAYPPIDQRPGNGIVNTTLTRRMLSGDVTVVLDSSRGGGSDSVQSVTIRPAP